MLSNDGSLWMMAMGMTGIAAAILMAVAPLPARADAAREGSATDQEKAAASCSGMVTRYQFFECAHGQD